MLRIDKQIFIRRYLLSFSLATFAIPVIGGAVEIYLGVYTFDEILSAVLNYTIFYIFSVYLIGVYVTYNYLRKYSDNLEAALGQDDKPRAERYTRKISKLIIFNLFFILIYTQGGPMSVNYNILVNDIRTLSDSEILLSYITTTPTILIILFPVYFHLYDQLGKYVAPRGLVINLLPIGIKVLILGMVVPLLIDVVLILFFHDRTGYFSSETIALWAALFSIAAAGAWLTYRSFRISLQPLQGTLNATDIYELDTITTTPNSLDEIGLLAQGWQLILKKFQETNKALIDERNFSNTIINNANAMFVVLDRNGSIVEFNQGCERTTGYTANEVLGNKVWDYFIIPEEITGVKQTFNSLLDQPINNSYKNYWKIKNGGRRLIDWSNSSIMGDDGYIKYIISIGIDVTNADQYQDELKRSKDTLDRAQAIAHIGHWDWNIVTNDLAWSDEIYRIFGLTPQEFEATYPAFLERIYVDDVDKVTNAVAISVEHSDIPYNIEHRIIRPDGEIRYVHEQGEIYRDNNGAPLRMVGTVLDITDQIHVKAALDQFKSTLDQTLDCIFMFDAHDLNFFYVNQGAMDQIGYTYDELLQMKPYDIKPDYDEKAFKDIIRPLLNGDISTLTFNTNHQHKDGHIIPVEIFLQYITTDNKPRFVAMVRDITERQKIENEIRMLNTELEKRVHMRTIELETANTHLAKSLQELQQTQNHLVESEKMAALGGLVAGVAHEINTPIGISVTAASHLDMKIQHYNEKYQNGELTKSDFESLLKAATDSSTILQSNLKRASELIRSFKQIAVDQSSEKPRIFNLYDYVDEILYSLNPHFRKGEYFIHNDTSPSLQIHSYPGAISQVLTNLIINSIVHGFHDLNKGDIWITFTLDQDKVTLDYRDNGHGIADENMKKIFDPFFTTMRNHGGSGLGMNIIYNIVTQKLGGNIDVTSKPGHGVHFMVTFPQLGEDHEEH